MTPTSYAAEVVAGVYAQIDERRARGVKQLEPSQQDWAHNVGIVAEKYRLTEQEIELVIARLKSVVDGLKCCVDQMRLRFLSQATSPSPNR